MSARTREAGAFSKPIAAALAITTLAAPTLAALAERPMTHHWGTRVWYALLRKPSFTPPHHVYPVAWQLIDGVLAWGAWRLARQPATRGRNRALGLLGASVAMIAGWPRIFFAKRELGAAALGSGALTATAAAYVAAARPVDRRAAAAGVPLVAWVGFATVLSAAIWKMNRPR